MVYFLLSFLIAKTNIANAIISCSVSNTDNSDSSFLRFDTYIHKHRLLELDCLHLFTFLPLNYIICYKSISLIINLFSNNNLCNRFFPFFGLSILGEYSYNILLIFLAKSNSISSLLLSP